MTTEELRALEPQGPALPETAQQAAEHVVSSAMLLMGLTGAGKTSLIGTLIEHVWRTYRKVSLLYQSDGGGLPPQIQALQSRGIVRVWKMRTRNGRGLSFETCHRASQGWWPKRINPHTGETDPNVAMVPSTQESVAISCPSGHHVVTLDTPARFGIQGRNCPTCNLLVTPATMVVVRQTKRTPGFEDVGAMFYDGLSSMCSWMMDDLAERSGRNELGGEKGNMGTVISGDWAGGSNNRASYGFVQSRAEAMVLASNGIPNLVIPPVWTALTLETSDEGGLAVRGPMIAGQAKTSVAGQWFGDTVEALVTEVGGKRVRRLMLQQWIDDRGAKHLCGIRSFPGMLPAYLEDEESADPNQAFRSFSLAHFYLLREEARRKTAATYDAMFADAPGLPAGDMEYGEPAAPAAPPSAAVAAPVSPAERARQRQAAVPAAPAPVPALQAPPPPGPKQGLSPAERARARTASKPAAAPEPAPVPTSANVIAGVETAAAGPGPAPLAPAPAQPVLPVLPAPPSVMATGPIHLPPPPPPRSAAGPVPPPPGKRPNGGA